MSAPHPQATSEAKPLAEPGAIAIALQRADAVLTLQHRVRAHRIHRALTRWRARTALASRRATSGDSSAALHPHQAAGAASHDAAPPPAKRPRLASERPGATSGSAAAHATATPVGHPSELAALTDAVTTLASAVTQLAHKLPGGGAGTDVASLPRALEGAVASHTPSPTGAPSAVASSSGASSSDRHSAAAVQQGEKLAHPAAATTTAATSEGRRWIADDVMRLHRQASSPSSSSRQQ